MFQTQTYAPFMLLTMQDQILKKLKIRTCIFFFKHLLSSSPENMLDEKSFSPLPRATDSSQDLPVLQTLHQVPRLEPQS